MTIDEFQPVSILLVPNFVSANVIPSTSVFAVSILCAIVDFVGKKR